MALFQFQSLSKLINNSIRTDIIIYSKRYIENELEDIEISLIDYK